MPSVTSRVDSNNDQGWGTVGGVCNGCVDYETTSQRQKRETVVPATKKGGDSDTLREGRWKCTTLSRNSYQVDDGHEEHLSVVGGLAL